MAKFRFYCSDWYPTKLSWRDAADADTAVTVVERYYQKELHVFDSSYGGEDTYFFAVRAEDGATEFFKLWHEYGGHCEETDEHYNYHDIEALSEDALPSEIRTRIPGDRDWMMLGSLPTRTEKLVQPEPVAWRLRYSPDGAWFYSTENPTGYHGGGVPEEIQGLTVMSSYSPLKAADRKLVARG